MAKLPTVYPFQMKKINVLMTDFWQISHAAFVCVC